MTGGGTVKLSQVRGGLRASSGSGPVIHTGSPGTPGSHESTGDLDGISIDKSHVHIGHTREGARGSLHIEKAGGDVDLDQAPEGAWVSTGGGHIRIGRAAGAVDASTGGGGIEIGPVAGSVTAGTGAGDVHVTLADAPGDEQNVEITSGSGRILVDLPPGFEGSFELETAYTRSSAPTRIESPWELARDKTTDWDASEGTPRRYVRAHGSVGNGGGLVRVHTVNGDITVRRGRR